MNAGLRAYLDKKKGKKGNGDKEENGNGNGNGNGKASKGSKPDFLDLDKDGNKTEPMKSAAKSKKEETEYNYVNSYLSELSKKTMGSVCRCYKQMIMAKVKSVTRQRDANRVKVQWLRR